MVEFHGYVCETHNVTTADQFVLGVHRLPGGKDGMDPDLPPVILQHGLVQCSIDWVIMGPGRALAYLLADKGYDVWLGNARGNIYSRQHEVFLQKEYRFWDWSWHEMGIYDLPALIDYVLEKTGHQKVFYVGHSMGTTMFYVMCSTRPEYNDKVIYMAALAPVAFMKHVSSPLQYLAPHANNLEKLLNFFNKGQVFTREKELYLFLKIYCETYSLDQNICTNLIFFMCGYNPEQVDVSVMAEKYGNYEYN